MLGMDHLHELCRRIDRWEGEKKESLTSDLLKLLEEIYDHPTYQTWLSEDQHRPPFDPSSRYYLHPEIGSKLGKAKRVLDAFSVVDNNQLQVKIDRIDGQLHLTDAPWLAASVRVFSFKDESQILCNRSRQLGWDKDCDILIDPACGCGHHMQGLKDIPHQLSFDISSRALVYCRLNSLLAGRPLQISAFNDLRNGIPDYVKKTAFGNVLFLVNMPFGIFPEILESQTPTQDGGSEGAELTISALKAISDFAAKNESCKSVRALVLAYSLGRIEKSGSTWRVADVATRLFEGRNVKYEVLKEEKLWRINGKKEQPNPMPLDSITLKSTCRQTYPTPIEQQKAAHGYRELLGEYKQRGHTHLSYGLVSIEVKREANGNER